MSCQIYFYFYSLLRAAVVSANRKRQGLPGVSAGSVAARSEDIGVPASLLVAAVAGAVNMVLTSPAQVRRRARLGSSTVAAFAGTVYWGQNHQVEPLLSLPPTHPPPCAPPAPGCCYPDAGHSHPQAPAGVQGSGL